MLAHLLNVGNAGQPSGATLACPHGRCGEAFEKPPRTFEKLSVSGGMHTLSDSPERTLNDGPEHELMHSVVRKQRISMCILIGSEAIGEN